MTSLVDALALYRSSVGFLISNFFVFFVCAPLRYLTSQIIDVPQKKTFFPKIEAPFSKYELM